MGEAVGQQAGRNQERGAMQPRDTEALQEPELGEKHSRSIRKLSFHLSCSCKGSSKSAVQTQHRALDKAVIHAQICWGDNRYCPIYQRKVRIAGAIGPRSF